MNNIVFLSSSTPSLSIADAFIKRCLCTGPALASWHTLNDWRRCCMYGMNMMNERMNPPLPKWKIRQNFYFNIVWLWILDVLSMQLLQSCFETSTRDFLFRYKYSFSNCKTVVEWTSRSNVNSNPKSVKPPKCYVWTQEEKHGQDNFQIKGHHEFDTWIWRVISSFFFCIAITCVNATSIWYGQDWGTSASFLSDLRGTSMRHLQTHRKALSLKLLLSNGLLPCHAILCVFGCGWKNWILKSCRFGINESPNIYTTTWCN